MVLLTPSAVSTIISGSIICAFTFLLFLSGYVLQQQTVRSLQEALRNPPEKVAIPTPTLPAQFQNNNQGDSVDTVVTGDLVRQNSDDGVVVIPAVSDLRSNDDIVADFIITRESLAYIFTLPDTRSLCSATSFAKRHGALTRLAVAPQTIFIYPATWDTSDDESHLAAMDLLRELQDVHSVVLHPVAISRVWAGISIEQQLLAELQRTRWSYDRAMYLSSSGMAVNVSRLDEGLALSNTKGAWTLLHPHPKSYEASHPPLLLWVAGRGLLYPRHEMKPLVLNIDRDKEHLMVETQAEQAAYLLFDDAESGHRTISDEGLFNRYDEERRQACAGTGILG